MSSTIPVLSLLLRHYLMTRCCFPKRNKHRIKTVLLAFIILMIPGTQTQTHPDKNTDKILRMPHPLEFGGADNTDPLSPFRFWQVIIMLYDQLIQVDADGEIKPGLATEWFPNEDATIWTFKLRQGVTFHNKQPFTSQDAVYSLQRVKDPELATPAAAVLTQISSVTATEPYTLVIHLNSPHFDFPLLLTDYRIRIIPYGSGRHIAHTGVGTGPFRLKSLDPEGKTVLEAFPEYWDGSPQLAGIELFCIPDSQARVQALLAGQIDWLDSVPARQRPLFDKQPHLQLQTIACGQWRGIMFRVDTPPFTDPRVRKALRIAADRSVIMQLVSGKNAGKPCCDNPVWPGDTYYNAATCQQNITLARRLLAEAGFSGGINIELYTSDIDPEFIPLAETYQQQVSAAGINITIRRIPRDSYWQSVWMKVPVMMTQWGQRQADQVLNEVFRSGAPWNESGYHNPAFDQLLDKARAEPNPRLRQQYYSQLQTMLYEDGGVFIPYFPDAIRVSSQKLTNIDNVETKRIRWHRIGKA